MHTEDVKDLKDAHEETRRASSRSIDVPRSRPGEVDLPSLDYSACSSLLQLNQSNVDMFKNAYLKVECGVPTYKERQLLIPSLLRS